MDGFNDIIGLTYGLSASGFYHFKRLQLGFRLHGVIFNEFHNEFDENGNQLSSEEKTVFEVLISPVVIGFTF